MFTGIITDIGTITNTSCTGDMRIDVTCHYDIETIRLGDSIACNGTCLTVIDILPQGFSAQLSAETIARTTPDMWKINKKLNLERAMKLGDTLDGHIVTGHIDGTAIIKSIEKSGDSHILMLECPTNLSLFIAQKGSVTLDGISLTVNKVEGNVFWVNIIPHTWQHTTLGEQKTGNCLNLEIDTIARYVARMLEK